MEVMARAAALCVGAAALALVVRQGSPPMALALSLGTAAGVLALLAGPAGELIVLFRELGERSGLPETALEALWKSLGVALVCRMGSELCRDAGEGAMASAVETAGAVCGLLAALPLLRTVLSLLLDWME